MSWLTEAIAKAKKDLGFKDAGTSLEQCPREQTGLIVGVERADTPAKPGGPVQGVMIEIQGKSPAGAKTNKDGLTKFKPIEPDHYKIEATLSADLAKEYEPLAPGEEDVSLGHCAVHEFKLVPLVLLKVKVVERRPGPGGQPAETLLDGVSLHIEGKDPQNGATPTDGAGWARFDKIRGGKYDITVTSLGQHDGNYTPPGKARADFSGGQLEQEVVIEVRPKAKLRIVLFDKEDKAISGKAWTLSTPIAAHGTTGGDGLIEATDLNLEKGSGLLRVTMGVPTQATSTSTSTPAPVAPANAPPPYPPPIVPLDFKDPAPPAPEAPDGSVEWTLNLGLLKDYDNEDGIKSRLHNLGFACEAQANQATTSHVVKTYQRHYLKQANGSGKASDIEGNIFARHDNP